MDRTHIKIFGQLRIRHIRIQCGRKRTCNVVVNSGMVVSIKGRIQKYQEQHHPQLVMLYNEGGCAVRVFNQRSVLRLLDSLVKHQNNGRQERNAAEYSHDNTFRHDDSDVASKCERHTAKCKETCHCCDRASDNGLECRCNRMPHCQFPVIRVMLFILLKAVQKKDRVVHRNAKLQYRGQRFRDVRNLPKKNIAAKIVNNCKSDTKQEEDRNEK